MSRRLLLLLAGALLVLAACSSTNYKTADGKLVHWQQNVRGSLVRRVEVVVPTPFSNDGQFMTALNAAVLQVNRTGYLRYTVDAPGVPLSQVTCPNHCVVVAERDLPYPTVGTTGTGWNSQGLMYGRASTTFIDVGLTAELERRVLCHELYHSAGLGHGDDPGPCVNGIATDWDVALVIDAHDDPGDPLYSPTLSTAQVPDVVTKTDWKDL